MGEGAQPKPIKWTCDELERAIYQWLANWNNEPKPFERKATAEVILDKVRR